MGRHAVENRNKFLNFLTHIYESYIPNKHDNLKQITLKVFFIVCLIVLIVSAGVLFNYFLSAQNQENIAESSRKLWVSIEENETKIPKLELNKEIKKISETLSEENPDYKAWIKIDGTKINYPIYQTDNNEFYLNHNQNRKKSSYGAIYFDYANDLLKDKNLIIYGHEMKNGSMFGQLKNYKSLSFYKEHPTIEFSTFEKKSIYKVYAVYLLNADKKDDNGYIYNIYRQNFSNEAAFDVWVKEACERSVINTNVDVKYKDNIITIVTCSNDFENARLIVMARETREGEEASVNTTFASVNANPRYPQKWYDERGMKNKF